MPHDDVELPDVLVEEYDWLVEMPDDDVGLPNGLAVEDDWLVGVPVVGFVEVKVFSDWSL